MASEPCMFCGKPVNPYDISTYKEIVGWVHGPKSDGLTLRNDTGQYAHEACILKAKGGNDPSQPDLFEEQTATPSPLVGLTEGTLQEFLENTVPSPTVASLAEYVKRGIVDKTQPLSKDDEEGNLPF